MKKKPFLKIYAVCITVLFLLASLAFLLVFHRAGYDNKLLVRFGLAEPEHQQNLAVFGWNNTLMKLRYDADVVFFGDSITADSDFQSYFPNVKILNSGYYGDTLTGMVDRVEGIAGVKPEMVFIMGGINGLTDYNVDTSIQSYERLLDELQWQLPDTGIIIQSVLPVSYAREHRLLHNETIVQFNAQLYALAQERGCGYLDLHSLYVKDGELNPEFTRDGLHLSQDAYSIWANALKQYLER